MFLKVEGMFVDVLRAALGMQQHWNVLVPRLNSGVGACAAIPTWDLSYLSACSVDGSSQEPFIANNFFLSFVLSVA